MEKEYLFLSQIIKDDGYLKVGLSIVNPDDLNVINGVIYKGIKDLFEEGIGITNDTILYKLHDNPLVANIIPVYLQTIRDIDTFLDIDSFTMLCKELAEQGKLRTIKNLLKELANEDTLDIESLIGTTINSLYQINHKAENIQSITDLLKGGDYKRDVIVSTTLTELDCILDGGFARGEFVIVAARPSVGKTTFGLQVAVNSALQKIPTLLFTLEQTKSSLRGRFNKIMDNNVDVLQDVPLWIDDSSSISIDQIYYKTQMLKMLYDIEVVIIDYVGLLSGRKSGQSMNEFLGYVSKTCQALARTLNITVILLSQLSRESVRENREPELHDLRDSGSLEQDADIVMFLSRVNRNTEEVLTDIKIAKSRETNIGKIRAVLDTNSMRFFDD